MFLLGRTGGEPVSIFFVADTHFLHGNIIKYCNRPWLRPGDVIDGEWVSEEIKRERTMENDETIIERWNSRVKEGDTVYHLGDFAFTRLPSQTDEIIERLNGSIYLVRGNHDKTEVVKARGFAWVGEKYQGKMVNVCGREIFISHYSHRVWDKSHHGVWHCHGHSHGTLPDDPNIMSMDVGVDAHDFYPWSIDEISEVMSKKTFKPVDHHA